MSKDDDSDAIQKAILARRAKFVAAALAGASVVAACNNPQPCLSPPVVPDPPDSGATLDTNNAPRPCLSISPPEPNAPDGSAPRPCLSPPMIAPPSDAAAKPPAAQTGQATATGTPPAPRPCLSVPMPIPTVAKPWPTATATAAPRPCLLAAFDDKKDVPDDES